MALENAVIARCRACALPEVQCRAGVQTLHHEPATPIVDVRCLRTSPASDSRDDLSQIVHVAASLVLCDVHDHKHPMRHLREAARPRIGRYIQNGLAHLQSNPILALRWLYASVWTRRNGRGVFRRERSKPPSVQASRIRRTLQRKDFGVRNGSARRKGRRARSSHSTKVGRSSVSRPASRHASNDGFHR